MRRAVTILFQTAIALLGIGVVGVLLFFPQVEGRNVNATQFEIYFKDPFLAYIYLAFIPFFIGLFQASRLVGLAGRDELFSAASVRAMRIIKYCAILMVVLFLGAIGYIVITMTGEDDIAGGVAMGLMITLACATTATVAAMLERKLQRSI